jgi:D-alanyl-D-alanine carboxypeptidase
MSRWLIILLFSFTLAGCASRTSPEAIVDRFMKGGNVPGAFVAVVRDTAVLYQQSFGLSHKERMTPLTVKTCMELGSISKVFTGEVIYDLHHAGLLNLNDPISKYLPGAPAAWSGITIKHLLTHTSGIQNYLLDPRFHAAAYFTGVEDAALEEFVNTVSRDSMVRMFYTLQLEFSPGTTWSYSNTGYYLLGKICEAVTGKDFFELVREKVTAPLMMHNTRANELSASDNCLANGYFVKEGNWYSPGVLKSHYAFSAGAWSTTGEDMIRFLKAINRRALPSDNTGYDWRNIQPDRRLPFEYDGGRFYTTYHGMRVIFHNGGTPGFSSSWIYVPEKNISIIVLINRQDYAAIDQ